MKTTKTKNHKTEMKTELTTIWKSEQLEKLRECLTRGREAFVQAGELVVDAIESGGLTLDELREATGIPTDVLAQLERIGRKQLNPHLMLADFPAARPLMRLPLSEQDRLMKEPVEFLIIKDGEVDKMSLPVATMTVPQVRQVFARNYVRPLAEQRSWLESQSEPVVKATLRRDVPYEITRRHTVIIGGNEFTVAELLRIAAMAQD